MTHKKRKKANTQNIKQEQRARFNAFKCKIINYLKLLDCEEVAGLFDDTSFSSMYTIRLNSVPKVVMSDGLVIDDDFKKDIISNFEYLFSNKNLIINDRLTVSAKEVMSYFMMIDCAVQLYRESGKTGKMQLVEKYLQKMPDFTRLYDRALQKVSSGMQTVGMMLSEMNSSLCWLKYISKKKLIDTSRDIIEVHEYIPKKRMMMIDNHWRPIYPLSRAFIDIGPQEISIPAELIKLEKPVDKKQIPVYVQNHLVHRLKERLDCIPPFMSEFFFYDSFINPGFIYFKGNILVEYFIESSIKLGYILLEYHEDVLLAKTFLLLPNSGTPEGEKLDELSGMNKIDHKYWAIDRLSTFHHSDLKDHPAMREIFEKAGCGSLFHELTSPEEFAAESPATQAQQMIRYLEGIPQDEHQLVAI